MLQQLVRRFLFPAKFPLHPDFDGLMCSLLWGDVCTRKEIAYQTTTYDADMEAVKSMCDFEPGCRYLSLEDYAASKQFQDDPTRSCSAGLLDVHLC